MGRQNRLAPFILLIVIFLLLQPALILLDRIQTPETAARAFVKDYFYLDPAMQNRLCSNLSPSQAVDDYLYAKRVEATQRGFDITYLRQMFTHLDTVTISQEDRSAIVHVTGTTRTAINPVYMTIGRWFGLGQNHRVDLTLELVKQDREWRVCGGVPGF